MSRKFTYEILLRVEDVEDNPDMPTLNINALAESMADQFPYGLKATVVAAHLVKSESSRKRPRQFSGNIETFLDGLVAAGAIVDDDEDDR